MFPFRLTHMRLIPALAASALMLSAQQLRVSVIDGNGAVNRADSKIRGPVVLVTDEGNNPIPGVSTTFSLPLDGPSGLFNDSSRKLTVFTDSYGRAAAETITLNRVGGVMRIDVSAVLFNQTGSASISQTNVSVAGARPVSTLLVQPTPPRVSTGKRKKVVLITLMLAGAGAGAYFGLARQKTESVGISVGTPSVGGPR